jgi:hypothetical protein
MTLVSVKIVLRPIRDHCFSCTSADTLGSTQHIQNLELFLSNIHVTGHVITGRVTPLSTSRCNAAADSGQCVRAA